MGLPSQWNRRAVAREEIYTPRQLLLFVDPNLFVLLWPDRLAGSNALQTCKDLQIQCGNADRNATKAPVEEDFVWFGFRRCAVSGGIKSARRAGFCGGNQTWGYWFETHRKAIKCNGARILIVNPLYPIKADSILLH
ncbi:hypothetical protein PoB_006521200 [Plakobranchus ocellatus]|uniref:Uncharacterized protein n=1 Tax=Plakobranchus ocellatus TaxID=259542 RepID=A0AAV4D3G4_9GAST|nr:hypothetical protein PoB_006521200 [Plakobranchus ocellatus]